MSKDSSSADLFAAKFFKSRTALGLGLIFCLAVVLRVVPILQASEVKPEGIGPYFDSELYHSLGYHLYKGKGFRKSDIQYALGVDFKGEDRTLPAFSRGPVYPLFIATVYRLFTSPPSTPETVRQWNGVWERLRVAQAVLDALICFVVFAMVRLIYPQSRRMPLLAAGLYCFSFYNIFYTRAILSETVMTFLVALMLLAGMAWLKKKSFWRLGVFAFFSAVAALCRPEYLLFCPFFAAGMLFYTRKNLKTTWRQPAAYVGLVLLFIMPWSLRNYRVFHAPILIATGGQGGSLYEGAWANRYNWQNWHITSDAVFMDEIEKKEIHAIKTRHPNALKSGSFEEVRSLEKRYMYWAWQRLTRRPVETVWNWIQNMPRLWYQDYMRTGRDVEPSGLLFLFYFFFAVKAYRRQSESARVLLAPILLLFIFLNLIYLPCWVEPRYGVPFMPGLIAVAAIGLGQVSQRVRQRR